MGSVVFAQLTAKSCYTLQWASLFSPQLPLPIGIWTPSNTWFLGPTRVLNPLGISIDSAVFAGLTSVTDRPTDRPTDHATRSVTIGRIYVRSTAMRPVIIVIKIIIVITVMTSGQSNLTKKPHRHRTCTIKSYLPGGANVHSLDSPESTSQTTSRSV